jgi:hypothetical protein
MSESPITFTQLLKNKPYWRSQVTQSALADSANQDGPQDERELGETRQKEVVKDFPEITENEPVVIIDSNPGDQDITRYPKPNEDERK